MQQFPHEFRTQKRELVIVIVHAQDTHPCMNTFVDPRTEQQSVAVAVDPVSVMWLRCTITLSQHLSDRSIVAVGCAVVVVAVVVEAAVVCSTAKALTSGGGGGDRAAGGWREWRMIEVEHMLQLEFLGTSQKGGVGDTINHALPCTTLGNNCSFYHYLRNGAMCRFECRVPWVTIRYFAATSASTFDEGTNEVSVCGVVVLQSC